MTSRIQRQDKQQQKEQKCGRTETVKSVQKRLKSTYYKIASNRYARSNATSEWKYAFTDLAAYDAEGNAYKYEVKEQPVDGYQSEVKGYDITNTKVAQTKVEGTKTWKDDNAKNRPNID